VVHSLFSYHQKNLGGPGSSRGTLERIRAGLTICIIVREIVFDNKFLMMMMMMIFCTYIGSGRFTCN
jgi:hypothetical protein